VNAAHIKLHRATPHLFEFPGSLAHVPRHLAELIGAEQQCSYSDYYCTNTTSKRMYSLRVAKH
jgi:hypothetical protein